MAEIATIEVRLADFFAGAGFVRREPPILQPAEIFLDFSGEDIRRRLFVTDSSNGRPLCLRPEFTIPLSLEYLEQASRQPVDVYATGPVFRRRSDGNDEFVQIDIERFGHSTGETIDAECFTLAVESLVSCGVGAPRARIGDIELIRAVLEALNISAVARRRLFRVLAAGGSIDTLAAGPDVQAMEPFSGVLRVLEGADQKDAKAFVKDVLSIAGFPKVGGRDIDAIADRFLRRAAGESGSLHPEVVEKLKQFLAITGNPAEVVQRVRAYAIAEGIELRASLELVERRIDNMVARGDRSCFDLLRDRVLPQSRLLLRFHF